MGKWAEERMKEILSSFSYGFPGGNFRVTELGKFGGEASLSIRKRKNIAIYDFNCKLKWELTLLDGEGNIVG